MNQAQTPTFYGLGIAPGILELIGQMKFVTPTPIQHQAIPHALSGSDVLGIAQTGTGKTLAFGIPMVQKLLQGPGRALVVVPTKELAIQVDETLRKLGAPFNCRTVVLIGGMNMGAQIQVLRKPSTRILVATPGRLVDHLEQKTVNLSDMKVYVMDEADRMLDMGFEPQVRRIAKHLPKDRQTMLFSATMPENILKIASDYMKLPIRVEIARAGTTAEKVTQELFIVRPDLKRTLLQKLLEQYRGSVLVFTRTKAGAKKVTQAIRAMGHPCAEIHANRSLGQRRDALEGFKTGRYRVMVATDIASRGIDVKGIELVVNYDLPDDVDNYVHRIGRTGRAGREGHAIAFATPDQGAEVRAIERLTQAPLKISTHPAVPQERFHHAPQSHPQQSQHRPNQGGGTHHRRRGPWGGGHHGGNRGGHQGGRPRQGGSGGHSRPRWH